MKVNTTIEREYSIVKNYEEVLGLKTFKISNKPIAQTADVTRSLTMYKSHSYENPRNFRKEIWDRHSAASFV